MRTGLELLRILFIIGLLGALGGGIIGNIYSINKIDETNAWFGYIAILILIFVLYRNKLQFSGWYKGEGRVKLPKPVTVTLVFSSILLMFLPFALGSL